MQITLKIQRFDPQTDQAPRFQEYRVEAEPADRVLDALERRAGRRFEHRSLIFFGILLGFAVVTFAIVQRLAPA